MVHSRVCIDCEMKSCDEGNVSNVLMEADKSGVWFAFVIWPWHEAVNRCALNFLRYTFGSDPVGYDELTLDQAMDLVRNEYNRLQRALYAQQPQQYYAQQPPQQQPQQQPPMMYGQPPSSMVPVQPGSVVPPSQPVPTTATAPSTTTS